MNGSPIDLAGVLKNCFGCKRPFRKNAVFQGFEDGRAKYSDVTKSGWKAYNKLVVCLYGLENIGVIDDANSIIEDLDVIITSNRY